MNLQAQILNGNGSVSFTCQTEEKVLDPIQNLSRAVPPFNAYAKNGIVNVSSDNNLWKYSCCILTATTHNFIIRISGLFIL